MTRLLLLLLLASTFKLVAQTHTIEIHENKRVASLLMSSEEYETWKTNDEFNNKVIREALFQDIYQKFDDNFDFIFLVLNEDERPTNLPYGQLIQVSNDELGLGMGAFDNSSNYGSAGKLEAVMHLTRRDYLRAGPSLHELMHNWGNFGIPTESTPAPGKDLKSFPYIPHWGFTGGSTKGQLGGFEQSTLVENGGNSYTVGTFGPNANGGNSIPYNELELYLMGMTDISSVSNFDVFSDITELTINASTFDFTASTRTTYTPASLEALLGTRSPSFATSQKDFTALVIVLTDTPLTKEQWDLVDDSSEKFGRPSSDFSSVYNFWEATNGLGTLETGNLEEKITSVEDELLSDYIRVYPNPVSDFIQILGIKNIERYTIYNVFGEEILNGQVSENQKIDINSLGSGYYLLKTETGKIFKIIKK